MEAGESKTTASDEATNETNTTEAHRVLFVGNSFISVNDVPRRFHSLLSQVDLEVDFEAVTKGGRKLAEHAQDARTDGADLAHWLRTASGEEGRFDAVILQEQSQVGGFRITQPARRESIAAAEELAKLGEQRGARIFLYLTWGYLHGDPPNTLQGYGSYSEMQDMLDAGYLDLATTLQGLGIDVELAPVGGAFRTVFEDVRTLGGDPLAEGSDFASLFETDGRHASPRGAYLAACIVAGSTTRIDVEEFDDDPTLGDRISAELRDVCARTLAQEKWQPAQLLHEDATLYGDLDSSQRFGTAVDLSLDGHRAFVGARGELEPDRVGFRVFERSRGAWLEEQAILDERFRLWENSLATNGDGSLLMIRSDEAPALLFELQDNGWSEDSSLPSPDLNCPGAPLALSDDGLRAIVAGIRCGYEPLRDWLRPRIFVRAGTSWNVESELPLNAQLANSVAMDGAGTRVLVNDGETALARSFIREDSTWIEESTLRPSNPQLELQGAVVELSNSGRMALIAQPEHDRIFVFVREDSRWIEEASLSGVASSRFGASVALDAEGTRLFVGAPEEVTVASRGKISGSVHVFERGTQGLRPTYLCLPSSGAIADRFGDAISVDNDGKTLLVGSPAANSQDGTELYMGKAHIFNLP